MTTIAYPITLIDTDVLVVKSALELLIEECGRQIKDGEKAPFYAYRISAKQIIRRLQNEAFLSSGNNLLHPISACVSKKRMRKPKRKP